MTANRSNLLSGFGSRALWLLGVAACAAAVQETPQIVRDFQHGIANPLDGFRVLPLPRSELEVGAQWLQHQGPIAGGLPENERHTVRSFSEMSFSSESATSGEIKLALLRRIGVNAGGGVAVLTTSQVRLDSLHIERVADIAALRFNTNTNYLWEGVKVTRMTIATGRHRADSLSAALESQFKPGGLSVRATGADSALITAIGLNLFVAYRVVRLEQTPPITLAQVQLRNRRLPVDEHLGSEYTVNIARGSSAPFGALEPYERPRKGDLCFSRMVLTAFNQVADHYGERRPQQYSWKMFCRYSDTRPIRYSRDDGVYPLPARLTDDGLVFDQLVLREAQIERDGESQQRITARIALERRAQRIVSLPNPIAAGW